MKKFDYTALKNNARQALEQAEYPPRKLALIHSGAVVALSLLITLIGWLCTAQIENAGGLGGMDQRIFLTTVESALSSLRFLILPFWCLGYVYAASQLFRKKDPDPSSLWQGFRRWMPALRLCALLGILAFGLYFASVQLATTVFLMTPMAKPLMEMILTLDESSLLSVDLVETITQYLPHINALSVVIFLLISYPLILRFRFSPVCLMEAPREGAFKAMGKSIQLMRGKYGAMLKLDLHFGWYHLLNLLTGALLWSDVLVDYLGIAVPNIYAWVFPVCTAVGGLCSLGLFYWRGNLVNLTYLGTRSQTPDTPSKTPPSQPWTY